MLFLKEKPIVKIIGYCIMDSKNLDNNSLFQPSATLPKYHKNFIFSLKISIFDSHIYS